MCGIAGVLSFRDTFQNELLLNKILVHQKPRGPDFTGRSTFATENHLGSLGHNRLSIIDLSSDSHQPFWDHSQRFAITFNGEIYNYLELREELLGLGYKFRTSGDTEVLLTSLIHWGPAALSRLNGMFAFALWDQEKSQLLIARDRFGVKPCYFYSTPQVFAFASSIKPIAEHFKLAPNWNYLARGVKYWVFEDSSASSPYENLYSLNPGSYLILNLKDGFSPQIHTYYCLKTQVAKQSDIICEANEKELTALVYNTFNSAIALRLRSDVPVAISISGGLDSTLIASVMHQQQNHIEAFHYGHPDFISSEGPIVEILSKKLNLKTHYIWPSPESSTQEFFNTLALQEAPFFNPSVVGQKMVFDSARSQGFKVLIGGQGSDESYMGYRKFFAFYLKELLHKKDPLSLLSHAWSFSLMLKAELPSIHKYWQQRNRYLSKTGQSSLLKFPANEVQFSPHPVRNTLEAQIQDIANTSLPTLLRYEDRNSMGHSIESRLPFMDYRMVELGLALPTSLKLKNGYGKWVLREIAKHHVPAEIWTAKAKSGFEVRPQNWYKAGLGLEMRTRIHDNLTKLRPYLTDTTSIDNNFSNEELLNNRQRYGEACILMWLCENHE